MSPGSLFAHHDFRLLLAGQTSQLGTQVSSVALPLLAVVTLAATPFEVGLINAASMVAFAVLGLPAGAWLDRRWRRPVLITSDIVRAVLLASVPVAAMIGRMSIAQLILVSLLGGVARVFFDVGYRSYLPSVIGKDQVLAGNASLELVRASGQVVGPGLGGLLVTLVGAASVVLVQAGSFAVSALTLLAIRSREPAARLRESRPPLQDQIVEGLRFVWTDRFLRATAVASALCNFSFAVASAVSFIFLTRTLRLSPTAVGLIIAGGSGTVLLGAALTTRAARAVGSVRLIWVSLAVTTPPTFVGALAQRGWMVVLAVLGIAAEELGQIVYAITSLSLRQRICPDQMLGRVNATMTVLIMGLFPLGAVAEGTLGELIGPRGTLLFAGAMLAIAPLILYAAMRGVRDIEDAPDR
jgi:MFS family permease